MIYLANFGSISYNLDIVSNFDVTLPSSMNVKIASLGSSKYQGVPMGIGLISLAPGEAVILGKK